MEKETTKDLLKTFLRRLTDLSGRNKAIYLPRPYSEQFVDIHGLSFLNGRSSFSIIENLISGKKCTLCAEMDSRLEANNEASSKLKTLSRTDRLLFEERGTMDLHAGWPFVHGKLMDGTFVRCPLLLFPVSLGLQNGQWVLTPRAEVTVSFNKAFLLAYAHFNKVQLPEALLDEDFSDVERDSTVFRTALYQLLQKNNLEVNFNPDNFRDELIGFKSFKKEEFDEGHGQGQLKLFPEALIGIFPQAGTTMVNDYLDLLQNDRIVDLETFFYDRTSKGREPASNFLQEVREERVYAVFALDSWQENALKGVKLGHSLVVQGPPGTGKSQLICNLVSDMIANEKKVLVVCQKRVALDVVFSRLKEKRLDDFVALVHDFRNDRKDIYEKAARQIERIEEYKSRNNSLDSIQLERKFFTVSRRIDQICEELENFKKFLFDDSECGLCVKEMYLMSDPALPAIELKQDLAHFKWGEVDHFKRKLRTYSRLGSRFLKDDYPWRIRKSFSGLTVKDLKSMRAAVREVQPWFEKLIEQVETLVGSSMDWEQAELFAERREMLASLASMESEVYDHFQRMADEQEEETSSLWLANVEKMILECFEEEGPELSVLTPHLGQFQEALYRTRKSRRNLIGLIRWELFSKDKFLITRILVSNGLKGNSRGFKLLEKKLDRRLNLEHNMTKLRTRSWIKVPASFQSSSDATEWFTHLKAATRAKTEFNALRGLTMMVDPFKHSRDEFSAKISRLAEMLEPLPEQIAKWKEWLLPLQIRVLAEDGAHQQVLESTLAEDFDALNDFDTLAEGLAPHEKQVIDKLHDIHDDWDTQTLENTFTNSLCLAWVDHIEQKHPELRICSTGKMEELEEELRELLNEKEAIGSDILLMRARERMTDNIEFNRLNNRVTYRDLHHQLTKKKKIWPLRKVVSEFEDDVFRLMPCWLASPESVSSIFPMSEIFDLVIFDEASQCFAEQGIPALYRGKQVVIAGDQQQLQPSDLYRSRWEEDNEDPDLESTSLLELGSRYLLEVSLQGHYRSRLPELIQFSNQHFYGGKLRMLPDREKINQPFTAIRYLKVEGRWENNCNLEEATRVAELVKEESLKSPGSDIGVITFNAPQQYLILDLLEKMQREQDWKIPDTLFVKNIENVQGDEKDTIIFSIGYARDKRGKLNIQFGSLSLAGGENRLNVAVTRAREQVIVVSSIDAEDLVVEDTKNRGPKLLKAYLAHAKEISALKGPVSLYQVDKHPAAWYLKRVIRNELHFNFSLEGNVPFCDFMVKKDNQYVALFLTDDDHYHESPSAKSAHGLVPRTLSLKKWKFKMLFSRNRWINAEKFWNDIRKLAN